MPALKNLEITEISLVKAGDDPEAKIEFYKSKEPNVAEIEKNEDERITKLEEMIAEIMAMLKPDEADEAEAEKAETEVEKAEAFEVNKEMVDLKKELDAHKAVVKTYIEKETVLRFEKAAAEFKNIPVKSEDLAKALREIDGLKSKDTVLKMLKTLDAQAGNSDLFKELGASGETTNDAGTFYNVTKEKFVDSGMSDNEAHTKTLSKMTEAQYNEYMSN